MLPKRLTFCLLLAVSAFLQSCSSICATHAPDIAAFDKIVLSQAFRDSIRNNTLTVGMPYSAVRMVFGGCGSDTSIQVAALGHRQELIEHEGLYSTSQDPNIQVFLNTYKTPQGDLYIWYGNMNFYKAGISANDSAVLYSSSGILPAHVSSLVSSQKFCTDRKLIKGTAIPYAEIYSHDDATVVSYWYDLSVSDSVTVRQKTQSTPNYPVIHMELGTTVVTSFHWK
jgi:hypothetical protein